MINTTDNIILFTLSQDELQEAVRDALGLASYGVLDAYELSDLDLGRVTTKSFQEVAFAKFVELKILPSTDMIFDEAYVINALEIYQGRWEDYSEAQFYMFNGTSSDEEFVFKKSYARVMRQGIGVFLVALYALKAVILPLGFDWPTSAKNARLNSFVTDLCPELLSFVRSLLPQSTDLPHPAFESIGTNPTRRGWFVSYATKLLLATGWRRPEDASLEDLVAICERAPRIMAHSHVLPFRALVDVLSMRYGPEFPVTVDDWVGSLSLRRLQSEKGRAKSLVGIEKERAANVSEAVVRPFDRLTLTMPGSASPEALSLISKMPGLDVDFRSVSVNWIRMGELYRSKTKRENLKGVDQALGYLNIYLFQYLLYWFEDNPNTTLSFPEWPNQLLTSVFVTRISVSAEPVPCTLMEMLKHLSEQRKWKDTYHYALLLQLEGFFGFLERHRDELPGCEGFSQPLWREEYPALSRSYGTNKMPVPRRLFTLFLDYFETLKAYQDRVTDLVLKGEMSSCQAEEYFNGNVEALDVAELANIVGLSPVLFFREKTIRLKSIPNCMAIRPTKIKNSKLAGGPRMFLPQPHAVNQIIVTLHTGLRHQHVQWLDATKFDSLVTPEETEFTQLHVNTDKVKTSAWEPRVRMRVIEVLRSQKAWRELIDMPGFSKLRFYEDNQKTKWPKILPLFSSSADGRPHNDSRYQRVWKSVLLEIQKLLPDIDEAGKHKMFKLLPPNIRYDDIELVEKRQKYGQGCRDVCLIEPATMITPHSARINVVSQYITILPADLIGKYITGQTAATVSIYVKLDEESLQLERTHQALALQERVSATASLDFINSAERSSARFIAADNVHSHFSKSFRSNIAETLVSYGCVSITMSSTGATGLDVLRETGGVNAAENKTEICPYGNLCPNEIVIKYKGFGRCGLCEYAVRSVDHLTAVSAKVKQFGEMGMELTDKIETALVANPCTYSNAELDRLDLERARLAEEETGWRVSENVLNMQLSRIKNGQDSRRWTVQKPEMLIQDLSRVAFPSNLTSFTLERLRECVAYPTLESPQMRARFDLLRRQLLARSGNVGKALMSEVPINVAGELAGLIRTIVQANRLSSDQVLELINTDNHLIAYPNQIPELLG